MRPDLPGYAWQPSAVVLAAMREDCAPHADEASSEGPSGGAVTEQELTRAIIRALNAAGIWAMRNNTGTRGRVSFGLGKGSADIIAIIRGMFVAIEVKLPKKGAPATIDDDQRRWRDGVVNHDARYWVMTSVKEALSTALDMKKQNWVQP
jgi:hypothetical protein